MLKHQFFYINKPSMPSVIYCLLIIETQALIILQDVTSHHTM